jgi:hypothetical protein
MVSPTGTRKRWAVRFYTKKLEVSVTYYNVVNISNRSQHCSNASECNQSVICCDRTVFCQITNKYSLKKRTLLCGKPVRIFTHTHTYTNIYVHYHLCKPYLSYTRYNLLYFLIFIFIITIYIYINNIITIIIKLHVITNFAFRTLGHSQTGIHVPTHTLIHKYIYIYIIVYYYCYVYHTSHI